MIKSSTFRYYAFLIAFTGVAALAVGPAQAHPSDMGGVQHEEGGFDHEKGHHRWLEKLNLTDDQKKKVDKIRKDKKESMKATGEQLKAEHQKLHEMFKGDATADQLREQHKKVAALRSSIGDDMFESFLQVREVLTPEQRKQIVMPGMDGAGPKGEHRKGPKN